jgi:hypothetical protein
MGRRPWPKRNRRAHLQSLLDKIEGPVTLVSHVTAVAGSPKSKRCSLASLIRENVDFPVIALAATTQIVAKVDGAPDFDDIRYPFFVETPGLRNA